MSFSESLLTLEAAPEVVTPPVRATRTESKSASPAMIIEPVCSWRLINVAELWKFRELAVGAAVSVAMFVAGCLYFRWGILRPFISTWLLPNILLYRSALATSQSCSDPFRTETTFALLART